LPELPGGRNQQAMFEKRVHQQQKKEKRLERFRKRGKEDVCVPKTGRKGEGAIIFDAKRAGSLQRALKNVWSVDRFFCGEAISRRKGGSNGVPGGGEGQAFQLALGGIVGARPGEDDSDCKKKGGGRK